MNRHATFPCTTRYRGVAIIEFALVLPFLMFVALLMIFFGKSMLSKQDTIEANRHFAWRQAKRLDPVNDAYDGGEIRDRFFRGQDIEYSLGGVSASRDAENDLVDKAHSESDEAGQFARTVVLTRFQGNIGYQVDMSFPLESMPLARFARDLSDRYFRIGLPWQHRDVSIWNPLASQFIEDFDEAISIEDGGDMGLVHRVRQLYLKHW